MRSAISPAPLTALENNVVDVTSIPGILFLMRGGESKYRVIMGPKELPLLPPAVGIATGDLMKKNPAKLRAILAGRREAVKFIYEHTAEASKIFWRASTRRCRPRTSAP